MEELCELDGKTRRWHEEHGAKHEFSPDGKVRVPRPTPHLDKVMEAPPLPKVTYPRDPALRLALIEAGVLTTEQLATAEAKLELVGGGGSVTVQPPATTASWTPEEGKNVFVNNSFESPSPTPRSRRARKAAGG